MPKPPIEVEMKLVAPSGAALRVLPEALREMCEEVLPRGVQTIVDRYYDTADWRFYRANYALRVRRARGAAILAMKSLHRPRQGVSVREELEQLLPAKWRDFTNLPGGAVAARVCRIAGGQAIRPLFTIRNRRRTFECRFGKSLRVVASADNFRVEAGRRRETLAEVELEIRSGEISELRRLGRLLAQRLGLSLKHRAKFRQGLDLAGLTPPRAAR